MPEGTVWEVHLLGGNGGRTSRRDKASEVMETQTLSCLCDSKLQLIAQQFLVPA